MNNRELNELKINRYLTVILSIIIILSLFTVSAEQETGDDAENLDDYFANILGDTDQDTEEDEEEKIFTPQEAVKNADENGRAISVGNKKFRIVIDKTTGYLYLVNLKNNKIWSSCPYDSLNDEIASGITRTNLRSNIVVNYISSDSISVINSYAGSILNDSVKYSVNRDTITAEYTFEDEGFVIPLEFTVTDTGMDVAVIFEKIKDKPGKRVNSIEVLPYFGAAGINEKGYMLIPDGCGAIINYNNGKTEFSPYEKEFFGGNKCKLINLSTTEEEEIRLPFYGMCSEDNAFVATVTQGAETASLNASVSGKTSNYNNIYTKAIYRAYDTVDLKDSVGKELYAKYSASDTVKLKKYSISYTLLSDSNANIVGMANAARRKLFAGAEKTKDNGEFKLYLDLFGAVQKEKAFLGFRFTGVQPLTTYKQAEEIISHFRKSGIKDLKIGYRYASDLTYKGKISSKISPSRSLGGKSGFKSLLNFAQENNVEIFPYLNFVSFKKNGNRYVNSKDSIMGLQLNVVELYPYNINDGLRNKLKKPTYLVAGSRYNKAKKQILNTSKKYGSGLLFDESANYIYSDYVRGGYQVDRVKTAQEDVFKSIDNKNNPVMMSNPNFYAIKYADYLSDIPMYSSGYYLFDEDVPLVQMILKGYIPYSTPSLNIRGINDNTVLKIIETGSNIKFNVIYNKGSSILGTELSNLLYGAEYSSVKVNATKIYKKLEPVFKKISGADIKEYSSQNSVISISYDNGIKIILNYNNREVKFGSVKVGANDYRIIEKGE